MQPHWVSLFADVPAAMCEASLTYWQQVTGWGVGEASGEHGEFLPLVPDKGDRFLWLQLVGRDVGGWHLDLHVGDVGKATAVAVAAGARLVRTTDVLTVLESPGGLPFCLFEDGQRAHERPPAPAFPVSGRSLPDQLCLDLPAGLHEVECRFWPAVTGWPYVPGRSPEFSRVNPPSTLPVQLLLQRLGDGDTGGIRAHLDMAADDPAAEVARHMSFGGELVRESEQWTTLRDPAGLIYCVTHRRPPASPR